MINLGFRLFSAMLHLQLDQTDSPAERELHRKNQRTLEAILADSSNNNNRYVQIDDPNEVGPSKKLIDRTTEV